MSSLQASSTASSLAVSSVNVSAINPYVLGSVTVLGDAGDELLFGVATPAYSPIVNETLILDWFGYSATGKVLDVSWKKISGPDVIIDSSPGVLRIAATSVGTVVIEGTATDSAGKVAKTQLQYVVQAPFSTKATLLQGRSDGVGVDLVVVGDGFTSVQQQMLVQAAKNFMEEFFAADARGIGSHRPLWNLWVIESVSNSSVIGSGNTLFKSNFNCAGIARLLCVENSDEVKAYVAQEVPQFDAILVAVNSDIYGGAGGAVVTFSLSSSANQVAIHELGHSFAGLADEYADNTYQFFPEEGSYPNITINPNPRTVKWKHWIEDINNIAGVDRQISNSMEIGYFLGGAYQANDVWRPTLNSLMRELGQPLGAVNSEAWSIKTWEHAKGINALDASSNIQSQLALSTFHLPSVSGKNLEEINWRINGSSVDEAKNNNFLVIIGESHLSDVAEVSVKDNTGLIRVNPSKAGESIYSLKAH